VINTAGSPEKRFFLRLRDYLIPLRILGKPGFLGQKCSFGPVEARFNGAVTVEYFSNALGIASALGPQTKPLIKSARLPAAAISVASTPLR
jgi:hypothetical protein